MASDLWRHLCNTCHAPVLTVCADLSMSGETMRLMGGTPRGKPEKHQENALAEAMENALPNAVGFIRC